VPLSRLIWVLGIPAFALSICALLALAGVALNWPSGVVWTMAGLTWVGAVGFGLASNKMNLNGAELASKYALARLALVAAIVLVAAQNQLPGLVLAGLLLIGLAVLAEPSIRALAAQAFPYAWGFEGTKSRTQVHVTGNAVYATNNVAVGLALALIAFDQWTWLCFWAGLVALGVAVLSGLDMSIFVIERLRFNGRLPKTLERLGPSFALHWQAPPGSLHQVTMWLDQLKALDKPFFLITRTADNFHEATALGLPVLHRVGLDVVGDALTPSLKTVFYVNTAILNDHMLRYAHLNHIQLNHGDSDKVASYSPVFRAYDKDFVAGQAAIDRFAMAGLATAPDFFTIVGRPQVAQVEVAKTPANQMASPVVLYAPTWVGNTADSDYTSLPWAPQIVRALLERDCTVVFRPHPYWAKNHRTAASRDAVVELLRRDQAQNGRPHVFGQSAEKDLTVMDCFNRSDAMISDVSSVVGDYLYSEKPFAMVAVGLAPKAFVEENPVARGSYVIDARTLSDEAATGPGSLAMAISAMLGDDPLAGKRKELKVYYLGDIPADRYAKRFIEEASRYV
ncbi:MAG: CDP-glycerol glycerophosphotransferase family protein, partial [Micrococcales bacterium]|nr:CDP-glycerol glycerophosphotransferase family protein [Micrococcales bacterium]